jgi:Methyltransferase domain
MLTLSTIIRKTWAIRLYLLNRGKIINEGSTSARELAFLATLAQETKARHIAEIGFNGGFSSMAFLEANPDAHVVSFDLGEHGYSETAKRYIDAHYPGRHSIVWGDSRETIPVYKEGKPALIFDIIFIDGGHAYETASSDLIKMKSFAGPHTVIIMDDMTPWLPWGKGPTSAWNEEVEKGFVVQDALYQEGVRVDEILPGKGRRAWAVGHYSFK